MSGHCWIVPGMTGHLQGKLTGLASHTLFSKMSNMLLLPLNTNLGEHALKVFILAIPLCKNE